MLGIGDKSRIRDLQAQIQQLQEDNDKLRAVINGAPNPMDSVLNKITQLLAGKEAAVAIALLSAIGKVIKDIKTGSEPDFTVIAHVVSLSLPKDVAAKATEKEIAKLATTGYDFIIAVFAVLK